MKAGMKQLQMGAKPHMSAANVGVLNWLMC